LEKKDLGIFFVTILYMQKKCQKNALKFFCDPCSFGCSNKYNWNKHLATTKHKNGNKMVTIGQKMVTSHSACSVVHVCPDCKRGYKYRSGLSRHRKKCSQNKKNELLNFKKKRCKKMQTTSDGAIISDTFNKVMDTMVKQQDQINKLLDLQKEMIPKLGNTNNNNMTINVFLNEHCKDAMNLTDFINGIKISLEDLEYTNQHGYVKGLSNIFTKHLTDVGEKQRPIHCSDKKRLQFYVKDGDTWDRDPQNTKIDESITAVTNKAFNELRQWQDAHPGYDTINSPVNKEWLEMIRKLSGGSSETAMRRHLDNIKKTMSQSLSIKEAINIKQ